MPLEELRIGMKIRHPMDSIWRPPWVITGMHPDSQTVYIEAGDWRRCTTRDDLLQSYSLYAPISVAAIEAAVRQQSEALRNAVRKATAVLAGQRARVNDTHPARRLRGRYCIIERCWTSTTGDELLVSARYRRLDHTGLFLDDTAAVDVRGLYPIRHYTIQDDDGPVTPDDALCTGDDNDRT